MEFKARKVNVPFKVLGRGTASVPVWVLPNDRKWEDDTSGYTLVPISTYQGAAEELGCRSSVSVDSLVDRRPAAEPFGVVSDEPLVSWRDLSTYGWGLDNAVTPLGQGVPQGTKESYWTVFFAQNVMRGLLTRIMATEMKTLGAHAEGEVYWTPWVEVLRNEVRAYANIPPVAGISQFAEGQIKAMWRRVLSEVTGLNRKNLEQCLQKPKGKIYRMQMAERTSQLRCTVCNEVFREGDHVQTFQQMHSETSGVWSEPVLVTEGYQVQHSGTNDGVKRRHPECAAP